MKIIGITGPTGAGKTTLLRYLESGGAVVIDCDALYGELMKKPSSLRLAVEQTFGGEFFPHGELDRQKLGKLVFENPGELQKLNALVYEHLTQELKCGETGMKSLFAKILRRLQKTVLST